MGHQIFSSSHKIVSQKHFRIHYNTLLFHLFAGEVYRLEDKYKELKIIRGESKLIASNHKLVMIGLRGPSFHLLSAFYRRGLSNTIGLIV